jgi:hypothetical protein
MAVGRIGAEHFDIGRSLAERFRDAHDPLTTPTAG